MYTLTFKQYLLAEANLSEDQLNEINWRALAAGGALAAGLAAGGQQAHAQDQQPSSSNNARTTASFQVSGENSPEYNQKMYPVYKKMLQDYIAQNPGMDFSFARDIVGGRWRAEYRTQVPSNPANNLAQR